MAERLRDTDWRDAANCRTADPNLFFPVSRLGTAVYTKDIEKAKAVCKPCPVQAECLRFAITSGEVDGVWGNTSPEERQAIIRRKRRIG